MNKVIKYIIFTIVFAGIIALAVWGYNYLSANYTESEDNEEEKISQTQKATEKKLQKAPDFRVLNDDGETVTLKEHIGKPIVLNFWATWCGPCKMEMPAIDKLYKEYKDEVGFIMVNQTDGRRETKEKVDKFINENGYSFPVYYDTEFEASYVYGVSSIPTSLFINAEGEIVDYHIGAMSEEILRKYINKIL